MSLRKKLLSAVIWNSIGGVGQMIISLIISIILSRILSPEEFGLIAIIEVFIIFNQVFINFGFQSSLIQDQSATKSDYSTIFTFNIIMGGVFTTGLFLLSGTIADFYGNPILRPIAQVMSFQFLINSLTLVHRARLSKKLNYRTITLAEGVGLILGGGIGIGMALTGFGVWSLVMSRVVKNVIIAISLWVGEWWIPNIMFCIPSFKKHLKFSSYLFAASIIQSTYQGVDKFLLGKIYSIEFLGIYNKGRSLSELLHKMPSKFIYVPLFASFSKIQNDIPKLRKGTKEVMHLSGFLFIPMFIYLILTGEQLIVFLLTEKWIGSVPFFRLFCIIGIFQFIKDPMIKLILSTGDSKTLFNLHLIFSIAKVLVIVSIAFIDIKLMVGGLIFIQIIETIFFYKKGFKIIKESVSFYIYLMLLYLSISISVALLLFYTLEYLSLSNFFYLLISGLLYSLIYVSINFMLKTTGLDYSLSYINPFFKKLKSRF